MFRKICFQAFRSSDVHHEVMNALISTADTTPEGIIEHVRDAEVRGQTDIRGRGSLPSARPMRDV